MLRELIETLEVLISDEPGLLLLEDLQWADPATLEWLNVWMLRRRGALVAHAATWRTGAHGVKGAEHQATKATRLLSASGDAALGHPAATSRTGADGGRNHLHG